MVGPSLTNSYDLLGELISNSLQVCSFFRQSGVHVGAEFRLERKETYS